MHPPMPIEPAPQSASAARGPMNGAAPRDKPSRRISGGVRPVTAAFLVSTQHSPQGRTVGTRTRKHEGAIPLIVVVAEAIPAVPSTSLATRPGPAVLRVLNGVE